jgi:hypothetical protein
MGKNRCVAKLARLYEPREIHTALVATLDGPTVCASLRNRVVAIRAPNFRPMIPVRIVGLFHFYLSSSP